MARKRRGGGRINRCNIRYGEGGKKKTKNRKTRANVELERNAAKSVLT